MRIFSRSGERPAAGGPVSDEGKPLTETLAHQALAEAWEKRRAVVRKARAMGLSLSAAAGLAGGAGMEFAVKQPEYSAFTGLIMGIVAYKRFMNGETQQVDKRINYLSDRLEKYGI